MHLGRDGIYGQNWNFERLGNLQLSVGKLQLPVSELFLTHDAADKNKSSTFSRLSFAYQYSIIQRAQLLGIWLKAFCIYLHIYVINHYTLLAVRAARCKVESCVGSREIVAATCERIHYSFLQHRRNILASIDAPGHSGLPMRCTDYKHILHGAVLDQSKDTFTLRSCERTLTLWYLAI